jgi:3-oxoacyl-[acyl-carrier-protein] synthase II
LPGLLHNRKDKALKKEIVITGIGVTAANAIGREEFRTALEQGISGIEEINSFDTSEYTVHRGGEVKGLQSVEKSLELPSGLGRTSRLALVATLEAVRDAGLHTSTFDRARTGVILGTTSGEVQAIESVDEAWALGRQQELPLHLYTGFASNVVTSCISSFLGLEGVTMMIANACASGNFAISFGRDLLMQGEADVIIAGGADSFSKVALAGFSSVHAIAPEVCQPFDKNRRGMQVSEGAGIVILEERSRAEGRGAKIYAAILGCGLGCDAFHLTTPDPEGMANAMRLALRDAELQLSDVDYINAHGTGTPANDAAETDAIKRVFGAHAYSTPVSSIKSMLGHAMGAASAIETVACCLALESGFVPPTINYQTPDPACDLDYVPNRARLQKIWTIMNNSFAFGGNNASLILGRS